MKVVIILVAWISVIGGVRGVVLEQEYKNSGNQKGLTINMADNEQKSVREEDKIYQKQNFFALNGFLSKISHKLYHYWHSRSLHKSEGLAHQQINLGRHNQQTITSYSPSQHFIVSNNLYGNKQYILPQATYLIEPSISDFSPDKRYFAPENMPKGATIVQAPCPSCCNGKQKQQSSAQKVKTVIQIIGGILGGIVGVFGIYKAIKECREQK